MKLLHAMFYEVNIRNKLSAKRKTVGLYIFYKVGNDRLLVFHKSLKRSEKRSHLSSLYVSFCRVGGVAQRASHAKIYNCKLMK